MNEFLHKMEDLLDLEEDLTLDMKFRETGEWDSLSMIAFLAMADAEYNTKLTVADCKEAITFADLYELLCPAGTEK